VNLRDGRGGGLDRGSMTIEIHLELDLV
jgi:hypothetical protein